MVIKSLATPSEATSHTELQLLAGLPSRLCLSLLNSWPDLVIVMLAFSMHSFVIQQVSSILADRPTWPLLTTLPDHCYIAGLFPDVVFSFVVREGLLTLTDRPAWSLLAIFLDQSCVTGLLPAMDSAFVS